MVGIKPTRALFIYQPGTYIRHTRPGGIECLVRAGRLYVYGIKPGRIDGRKGYTVKKCSLAVLPTALLLAFTMLTLAYETMWGTMPPVEGLNAAQPLAASEDGRDVARPIRRTDLGIIWR